MTDEKTPQDEFENSWIAKLLRGEEKLEVEDGPGRAVEPLRMRECAYMDASGKISVHVNHYTADGDVACGDYDLVDASADEYKTIIGTHVGLKPGSGSVYVEYHDGRWALRQNGVVVLSGFLDASGKRQSA